MMLVKAYEMSRLAMIFFALRASYASSKYVSTGPNGMRKARTSKKEKTMQPKKSHLPTSKGM